jgi:hypothetical protein
MTPHTIFNHSIKPNEVATFDLFDGYQYKNINKAMQELIHNLFLKQFVIFDYTPFDIVIEQNHSLITRSNLSAFMKKDNVMDFAQNLSRNGYIVCIFDENLSVVCLNGIVKKLEIDDDFITTFKQTRNGCNMQIENIEHVWDYGTCIGKLKNLCDKSSYKIMKKEYIEIAILSETFDSKIILDDCMDYINKHI